jgi:hypothetical protein
MFPFLLFMLPRGSTFRVLRQRKVAGEYFADNGQKPEYEETKAVKGGQRKPGTHLINMELRADADF